MAPREFTLRRRRLVNDLKKILSSDDGDSVDVKFCPVLIRERLGISRRGARRWSSGSRQDQSREIGGTIPALQIRVDYAAIEFRHVVVHYSNGSSEEVQVRQRIRADGSTRNIELAGRDRSIESVELWYERANYGSRRPRVRLFGFETL